MKNSFNRELEENSAHLVFPHTASGGAGINDVGQVTGTSTVPTGNEHAFLYSDGQMIDLGTLGGRVSFGYAINNAGQVTGASLTSSGEGHAFLYSNGRMMDLNSLIDPTLGITLGNATGINNHGQIIANGHGIDLPLGAFLLTPVSAPVPEPGTGALLGLPLLALLVGRRLLRRVLPFHCCGWR